MNNPGERFERLEHRIMDGVIVPVPVFYDGDRGLTDRSNTLLQAARIIGAKAIVDGGEINATTISERAEQVQALLENQTQAGEIIEDPLGGGAVNIGQEHTTVYWRNGAPLTIGTVLLMDMLRHWVHELSREGTHHPHAPFYISRTM